MREEEVEVEQVLPEELEAMLEDSAPAGKSQSFLQKVLTQGPFSRSWLEKIKSLIFRWNRLLDNILSKPGDRNLQKAGIASAHISRRLGARLWRAATRESALQQKEPLDTPEDFAQLLQPLSSAEMLILQKEIEADTTVFSRIEVVREGALLHQRKGFIAGVLVGLLFILLAGPGYVTETIYGTGLPTWIPASSEVRDWFAALFFILGILLPFLSVFQIAEAVRILLVYRAEGVSEVRRAWALPLVLSGAALVFLLLGGILPALLLLVFAHFWMSAERSKGPRDLE